MDKRVVELAHVLCLAAQPGTGWCKCAADIEFGFSTPEQPTCHSFVRQARAAFDYMTKLVPTEDMFRAYCDAVATDLMETMEIEPRAPFAYFRKLWAAAMAALRAELGLDE